MDFRGVIIEESLDDASVLKGLKIEKTEVEKVTKAFNTPWLKQWTLHYVVVSEKDAEKVATSLSKAISWEHRSAWFANLANDKLEYVVFRDRIFKANKGDKTVRKAIVDHGLSLGIPAHQLRGYKD